ncbi:MAG: hypothetical protein Q7J55_06050, partial [bacterium]|nr:hypothetical protein [bacterium]
NENNTHLIKIVEFLKKKHSDPKLKKIVIEDYWKNKPEGEEDVNELANEIKHRWFESWLGIEYRPSKEMEITPENNLKIGINQHTKKRNFYNDLENLRKVNNSFVECALSCEKILEQ